MGCYMSLFDILSSFLHWEFKQFWWKARLRWVQNVNVEVDRVIWISRNTYSSWKFIGLGIDSVSRNIFSPMNTVIEMIDNPHYVWIVKSSLIRSYQSLFTGLFSHHVEHFVSNLLGIYRGKKLSFDKNVQCYSNGFACVVGVFIWL